ncbi:MAG: hypothetical protein HYZ93_01260 [Candidatus Omnitrophica bacterium]|nr:hypothetical protein [Candidatus Omnitrophota bacterium]
MKIPGVISKAFALALSIALALPGSASALRVSQEGTRSEELQRRLAPAAGLEEGTLGESSRRKRGNLQEERGGIELSGRGAPAAGIFDPGNPTPAPQAEGSLPPGNQTKYLPSRLPIPLTESQRHPQDSRIKESSHYQHLQPKRLMPNEGAQNQSSQDDGPGIGQEVHQRAPLTPRELHPSQVYPTPLTSSSSPATGRRPVVRPPPAEAAGLEENEKGALSREWADFVRQTQQEFNELHGGWWPPLVDWYVAEKPATEHPPLTPKVRKKLPKTIGYFLLGFLYDGLSMIQNKIDAGDFVTALYSIVGANQTVKHILLYTPESAGPLLTVEISEYRRALRDLSKELTNWSDRLDKFVDAGRRLAPAAGLEEGTLGESSRRKRGNLQEERGGIELSGRGAPAAGLADRSGEQPSPETGQTKPLRTEPTDQTPPQAPPLPIQGQGEDNQQHIQPQPNEKGPSPEILSEYAAQNEPSKHRITGVNGDLQQGVALLSRKLQHTLPIQKSTTLSPTHQPAPGQRPKEPPLAEAAGLEELSPKFLAYERGLAERINREGRLRISLKENGLIQELKSSAGEIIYDANEVVVRTGDITILHGEIASLFLLAYTPESGLLTVSRQDIFWHFHSRKRAGSRTSPSDIKTKGIEMRKVRRQDLIQK